MVGDRPRAGSMAGKFQGRPLLLEGGARYLIGKYQNLFGVLRAGDL
jgi:hypothetical protein